MSDFEVMPVGTRAAMRDAAVILRGYADHYQARLSGALPKPVAVDLEQRRGLTGEAAARLEALLEQPGVDGGKG